jgi:hypothetical protein
MDYYSYMASDGSDERNVIESIRKIDEQLKEESSEEKRTRLMYEQMLRGLRLTQNPMMY